MSAKTFNPCLFAFKHPPQTIRARQMKYIDNEQQNQIKSVAAPTRAKPEQRGGERSGHFSLLGNNAKSSDTFSSINANSKGLESNCSHTLYEHVDTDTGEVVPFKKNPFDQMVEDISFDKILTEKYLLQSSARFLMPFSRTANCNRLSCGSDVGVLKSHEHKTTSFTGLQTCGSPWACTVCSSKISERRKVEVIGALDKHIENNGSLFFVTFTFRHSRNDSLSVLREKQKEAFKHLRSSRGYRKYKKHVGYIGLIRALEVTWGESNGWHPHTHEIIFGQNNVSFQSIKRLLFPAWVDACEKSGLPAPSFRRGVDVQGGSHAGSYVTKYGNELTKSHLKKARGDRFSPFDLLRSYFYDDVKRHGAKFVEFSEGMQGSRQLYWTNGLKKMFNVDEKSDDTLANESQEYSYLLGNIPFEHWKAVIKYKARSTVLIIGKDKDFESVTAFVNTLFDKYVKSGDQQKDKDRVLRNREKYNRVTESDKKRISNNDDRCIFVKLNEKIDYDKSVKLFGFITPDVLKVTNDIFNKGVRRGINTQFNLDNYIKPKKSTQKGT